MDVSHNGQSPSQHPRTGLFPMDGWARSGLGVLVAAFCAVMVAAVLPLGDALEVAIHGAARFANVAVLATFAVRWVLRWRRTGRDAVSDMELSVKSQRFLRGCIAVEVVLLMALGAIGGVLAAGGPLLPRLIFVLTFAGAGIGALSVVTRRQTASGRQLRAGSSGEPPSCP